MTTRIWQDRWTIGDVTITKIVESEPIAEAAVVFPQGSTEQVLSVPWLRPDFATEDGLLRMSIHALVVETRDLRIMVDTCVGNDRERPGWPHFHRLQTGFLNAMEAAGYAPDGIDVVLCTHLHLDHVGWNTMLVDGRWVPTFPRARYLFNRTEFEYWRSPEGVSEEAGWNEVQRLTFADSVQPVVEAGLVDLVEGTHRVCDEVTLVPTVGHSPGHVSVRISSRGASALITGDFAHHPSQLAHLDWSVAQDFDYAQAVQTRRDVFSQLAGEPTLVIGTHWGGATAGRVERDGSVFRLAT